MPPKHHNKRQKKGHSDNNNYNNNNNNQAGFIPPGASRADTRNAFGNQFDRNFIVPPRIAKVPVTLIEAVNDFHFAMMNDTPRNQFYYNLLKKHIIPGVSTVLEIGAGSGLLSMMAARLGAKWVLAVEGSKEMCALAQANIEQNKLSDKIKVLNKLSTDLTLRDLPTIVAKKNNTTTKQNNNNNNNSNNNSSSLSSSPERPDILVSEIFGTLLLGESALDYIEDARRRILRPDSVIIPQCGVQYAVMVECPTLESICSVSKWNGIDLSMVNSLQDTASCVFTKKYGFRMSTIPFKRLSDPIPVLSIDFASTEMGFATTTQSFVVPATSSGTAHAMLLFWASAQEMTTLDAHIAAKNYNNSNGNNNSDNNDGGVDISSTVVMSTDPADTIDNFPRDMQWGQALQLLDGHLMNKQNNNNNNNNNTTTTNNNNNGVVGCVGADLPIPVVLEGGKRYDVLCSTSGDHVVLQFNVKGEHNENTATTPNKNNNLENNSSGNIADEGTAKVPVSAAAAVGNEEAHEK